MGFFGQGKWPKVDLSYQPYSNYLSHLSLAFRGDCKSSEGAPIYFLCTKCFLAKKKISSFLGGKYFLKVFVGAIFFFEMFLGACMKYFCIISLWRHGVFLKSCNLWKNEVLSLNSLCFVRYFVQIELDFRFPILWTWEAKGIANQGTVVINCGYSK